MKIAIPVYGEKLTAHFGHCEKFAVVEISESESKRAVAGIEMLAPPDHAPGIFPKWLADQGVSLIIAGGIGGRAVALFDEMGIKVVSGAQEDTPENIAAAYLDGRLQQGDNLCDH